jgi:hypothetical protein
MPGTGSRSDLALSSEISGKPDESPDALTEVWATALAGAAAAPSAIKVTKVRNMASKLNPVPLWREGKLLNCINFWRFLALKPTNMKQSSSRALSALIMGVAFAMAGCGDSSEPLVPGSLQIVTGDGQTAVAGTAVAVPPSVKLLSTTGKPMSGGQVTFASAADGTVTPALLVTDAQGIATLTSWTLPKRAGSHQLTVSSQGVSAIAVSATATAGAATRMTRNSQDVQTGIVGAAAAVPPSVLVTDANDNPVAGVGVRFEASGNGSVRTANAVTGVDGIAHSETWTLGTLAGGQSVLATIPALPTIAALGFSATAAPAPAVQLKVVAQPVATDGSGQRFVVPPSVEIQDNYSNLVASATTPITVSIAAGSAQTLNGTLTVVPVNGRATFSDLVVTGAGTIALQFTAGGLVGTSTATFNVPPTPGCVGNILTLNYQLGQMARFVGTDASVPNCLDFPAANAGQQYLVQFENISASGSSSTGVFPGATTPQASFTISVRTKTMNGNTVSSSTVRSRAVPAGAVHSWEVGDVEVFEVQPAEPVGGVRPAMVVRGNTMMDATASNAAVAVGDTIVAQMEAISRLGIPFGSQRAVVRYVGPDLIIAEDVRLGTTLRRQSGALNTPLTMAEMEAIAADYAAYAKVQADLFFGGRYNTSIEANGNRVIAIHSIMGSDNIWGYTYPSGNYFVWDFWAGTADGATKTALQSTEWNANNLFMHEIAHMRHFGMNERAGKAIRGNTWVVEGFARATERWPIAMRLLNTVDFARTNNQVLPRFTTSTLNSVADVPDVRYVSATVYGGYQQSAYIFDYFADQVARTTSTNWRTALGDFLVNAGTEADLNAAIRRYLPGVDFGTLFTRARVAIFTDDYGAGLPDWTQFHQFQLRASRTAVQNADDPRNLWGRIAPGTAFEQSREVSPGGSFGYIIDGTAGSTNTRVTVEVPRTSYGVISITRIK